MVLKEHIRGSMGARMAFLLASLCEYFTVRSAGFSIHGGPIIFFMLLSMLRGDGREPRPLVAAASDFFYILNILQLRQRHGCRSIHFLRKVYKKTSLRRAFCSVEDFNRTKFLQCMGQPWYAADMTYRVWPGVIRGVRWNKLLHCNGAHAQLPSQFACL